MTGMQAQELIVVTVSPGLWPTGLTDAVLDVTRILAERTDGDIVTVLVPEPPVDTCEREALREALRSVVHVSVLERPKIRVNLVFGGSAEDREDTVSYVADASFVVGASIDLGGAR